MSKWYESLAWKIEIDPSARDELARLDRGIQRRITRFLAERLGRLDDPRSIGAPLRGPVLGRFWKYRIGAYRVICDIQQPTLTVLVLRIGHRREVYR